MNNMLKQEIDTRLQYNGTCVTEHIPQVSVCMPMYNASKYLRECINSVLAQTFKDFEFLIVDDGSDDDSVEIVKSYHDDRIRLQISLDGNRNYHNRSRIGINHEPTYDVILKNIVEAAKRQHSVSVRLNYTAGNAQTFVDVLEDFSKLPIDVKRFV